MTIRPIHGAIAVVAAAFLGYAFGRQHGPERAHEKVVHVVHERGEIREAASATTGSSLAVAFTRTVEERPDGTRIETNRAEAVREVVKTVEVVREVEVERVVFREKEQLVESPKPAWRATLDLGLADAPHRVEVPCIPRQLPIVATAGIDRRLVGPVFVGAFVSSTPAAGVRLSMEF